MAAARPIRDGGSGGGPRLLDGNLAWVARALAREVGHKEGAYTLMATTAKWSTPGVRRLSLILLLWVGTGCLRTVEKGQNDSGAGAPDIGASDAAVSTHVQGVERAQVGMTDQVATPVRGKNGTVTFPHPDRAIAGAKDIDCLLTSSSAKVAVKYGSRGCFGGVEHQFAVDVKSETHVRGALESTNGERWIASTQPISGTDGRS